MDEPKNQAHSLPGDVGKAIDQAILWARDDKCSYPDDAEKFDQRIEILRAALTPSARDHIGDVNEMVSTPSALSGDAGEARTHCVQLDWINVAGSFGSQAFYTFEQAQQKAMAVVAAGGKILGATEVQKRNIDVSDRMRAALPSHQGAGDADV